MSRPCLIWGASGHGLVVADALQEAATLELAGFIDDDVARHGTEFAGSRVLGGQEVLADLFERGVRLVHVAIGRAAARRRTSDLLVQRGFELCTLIHPRASIAQSARIGAGTFLAAGAVVSAYASVGKSVILNTSASIDHECSIDDGVHVGPGAQLGGNVSIGRDTWIGIGATILHGLKIGEHTIIGGGAVVVNDMPAGVVAYGVPATVRRAKGTDE